MPLTVINLSKTLFSSAVRKPNRASAFSL